MDDGRLLILTFIPKGYHAYQMAEEYPNRLQFKDLNLLFLELLKILQ